MARNESLSKKDKKFNSQMENLEAEAAKTKLERSIAENKKATAQAKKDEIELSGYLASIEDKVAQINEWENSHKALEKTRQESYDKMVQELKNRFAKIDQLIDMLLGFIEIGRVSQYRDLDSRISNNNLLILEAVVQEIKKERSL